MAADLRQYTRAGSRATRVSTPPPGSDEAHRTLEGRAVKKFLVSLALTSLLVLASGATASAQSLTVRSFVASLSSSSPGAYSPARATLDDVTDPVVSTVDPASAPDDGNTSVTITGTGFVATPAVSLGSTPLTDVTWVDGGTLSATVPGGITPGVYPLTVVNPDGGSDSLPAAFTVTAVIPTVSAIDPVKAANDIDTSVTISGNHFVATPTVSLGATPLTNVTWVDSGTLTATVPWGINSGTYDLTVVNPDGGGTLSSAFTVETGIGQWNAGELYGGEIDQLLMKPGDSSTLYALAYGVIGLFRSDDAGDHWAMVSAKVWANNNHFAADALHPDWLYAFTPNGLMRSQDDGDSWATLMANSWPDGRDIQSPQVYVSPYEDATHPQALFVSSSESYGNPDATGALGLVKSTDGGATWTIVPSLDGVPVQDIAFDPNDHSHLVAVTSDMRLYTSSDWGDTWTKVTTSGLTPSSLGFRGSITYNPDGSELWIDSFATPGGLFKSAGTSDLTSWQDVSQASGQGSASLAFTAADSVYIPGYGSTDGGTSWAPFGPSPWYGYGTVAFDPTDSAVGYIGNDAVGVQKTTDGGQTWQNKVDGLTGLSCTSLAVSHADPLRVYATFNGPQGIYRSDDGTSSWSYLPIAGSWNVRQVLVDPFDPQSVYVGADPGFYASTDGGADWSDLGWSMSPSAPNGLLVTMAADPFQAGHLLASFGGGSYGVGPGWLYSSSNDGASWQAVTVDPDLDLQWITSIVFDPDSSGTVYLSTKGTGIYKSIDHGAIWNRIDDLQQPDMADAGSISIATHPQQMLLAGVSPNPYRSLDGGATWQIASRLPSGGTNFMFADNDSTRLYFASPQGLFFSSDAGNTWERAAGAFGQIQSTALGYADADGHTILYAATNGGQAGTTTTNASRDEARRATSAAPATMVDAGIYRFVVVTPKLTLELSGLRGGTVLRFGTYVTARGLVTPSVLAGGQVKLQWQRWAHKWVAVKTALRTIASKGAYSWWYKPARKGFYRLRVTIAKTATHAGAQITSREFRVR